VTSYDKFLSTTGQRLAESALRRMGTALAGREDLVSFAPGYPDPLMFPWEELRDIAGGLLARRDPRTLQYGPTRGFRRLRETALGLVERRGIAATLEQLVVTSGSQQGIDLIARVLLDPGDVVLVESPTFTGAVAAFRNARAEVVGIGLETDGIDLGGLDRAWQRASAEGKTVKFLYVIPNFQNPTGTLLSLHKRTALVDWATRRDVLIVEDDPYGFLYFVGAASEADTRPICADDPSGRTLYLNTVSKMLAPGFRVGWMLAPRPLADRFDTAKQSTDLSSGILDQLIVDEALRRGVADRLAPRLRERYQSKCRVMEQALARHLGATITWRPPAGGFFIWATLPEPWTDAALLRCAEQEGVIFVTGSAFHVDGQGQNTIRLSFATPPPADIDEGVRRLSRALRHTPRPSPQGRDSRSSVRPGSA
jgi:2-aminoadipate transaminase